MKIIVDKIDEYPRHAISRADIHLILSAVPAAWSENVKVVRLSASGSAASVALYARPHETLTIASRGHTKEGTLHRVLVELAGHARGFKHRAFQHLQSRYESQIETLVAPLMAELLPQLSQKNRLVNDESVA